MKQAVLIADAEGSILFANEAAGEMLGCPVSELSGLPFSQFVTPEDLNPFFPNLLYLGGKNERFDGEIMLARKDKGRFIAQLAMLPITIPGSGERVLSMCIQDIHGQKQIEQAFGRSHYPDLIKIADGIAHEIRNPLVGIGGFAQRLFKDCPDTPENMTYFNHLMDNVKKIDNLIQKVEFFSKLPKPVLTRACLRDAVEAGLENHLSEMEKRQIDLLLELGDVVLCIDPEQIARAVSIFVANALDAVPDGGRIEIRAKEDTNRAVISVADNGKGISSDDLEFIFNPFFSTKPAGAGIDLAIVKRIAEGHDGRVEVDSKPGKNTTFSLILPKEKRRSIRARLFAKKENLHPAQMGIGD